MSQPNHLSDSTLDELERSAAAHGDSPMMLTPECVESLVAEVRALRAEKAEREAREPDYCHDDEWEYTKAYAERDDLAEYNDPGDIVEIHTLYKGPSKFVAIMPLDENDTRDPRREFNTKEEARAAIDAARAEGVE